MKEEMMMRMKEIKSKKIIYACKKKKFNYQEVKNEKKRDMNIENVHIA